MVHSYLPVSDATRLDQSTYAPCGCTALYDTWCDALAANVAYAEQLRASGTPCRSVVVVITDGEDTSSRRRAGDCARISSDLLASEQFVLAFVGVGNDADFRRVARSMGVPDGCIEVQKKATPAALRRVFQMVSQSTIRASQGLVAPGPAAGFFPFIVSVLLAIASLYNLTMAILKRDEDWAEDFVSIVGFQRILMIIVPLILFIAAIHYIGIYVASALFIAGFMIAFGHSSLVKAAAVGIGVPLALFFMFERWFLVPLPKGPLEAMLGF